MHCNGVLLITLPTRSPCFYQRRRRHFRTSHHITSHQHISSHRIIDTSISRLFMGKESPSFCFVFTAWLVWVFPVTRIKIPSLAASERETRLVCFWFLISYVQTQGGWGGEERREICRNTRSLRETCETARRKAGQRKGGSKILGRRGGRKQRYCLPPEGERAHLDYLRRIHIRIQMRSDYWHG